MTASIAIEDMGTALGVADAVETAGRPVLVTRGGQGVFVAVPADDYENMRAEAARAELYQLVEEGLADVAAGRCEDADAVIESIGRKYALL